jgi:hypothetical protein
MKNDILTFCFTTIVRTKLTRYENEKKKSAVLARFTTAAGCETFVSTFGARIIERT